MNEWAAAAKGVRAIRSATTVEQVDMAGNYFNLAFIKVLKKHRKKCRSYRKFMQMMDDFDKMAAEIVDLADNKIQFITEDSEVFVKELLTQ